MTTSQNIQTDALDFAEIKENIKEYLRGQSQFTDYDFDGSAMSIFLDVLAYNTHYNALYTNLAINEMFLDSASKYSSAVSLAKTLGYTAKSVTSATAKINFTVYTSNYVESLILPAGTVFRASVGDEEFNFLTKTDVQAQGITTDGLTGRYDFLNVQLIEGTKLTKRYTISSQGTQCVITSREADISSLNVRVQDHATSSNFVGYGPADNFLGLTGSSTVFFLKQREDLYYEVYFGNDVIGKKLSPGNVVHLDYIISAGEAANGANNFVFSSSSNFSFERATIQVLTPAFGGASAESIDSIRFNAPRAYASQNRAVTVEDYKNMVYTNFPTIESLTAWGGQDNDPPIYGKVFIAAKPYGANVLTFEQKEQIVNFLKNTKGIVSVTPVLRDPEFLRVEVLSSVYYDRNVARKTVGEIKTSIINALVNYGSSLGKFGSNFRFSKAVSVIDGVDDSITSNITTVRVRKTVTPNYNKSARYVVKLNNAISRNAEGGSFYSTRFYHANITDRCYLKDNGNGAINMYSEDSAGTATLIKEVGAINYTTGTIDVSDISIAGVFDTLFEFVAIPLSSDIFPAREYIVELPESLINIQMIIDTSDTSVGNSYSFSNTK